MCVCVCERERERKREREREMRVPSEYGERGNIWSSGKGGRAAVDNSD